MPIFGMFPPYLFQNCSQTAQAGCSNLAKCLIMYLNMYLTERGGEGKGQICVL